MFSTTKSLVSLRLFGNDDCIRALWGQVTIVGPPSGRKAGRSPAEPEGGCVTRQLSNFIGGNYVDGADAFLPLVDPSTGEVFAEAPLSRAAEVDVAFVSAAAAFPAWRDATPSERSLALIRIADALEAGGEAIIRA